MKNSMIYTRPNIVEETNLLIIKDDYDGLIALDASDGSAKWLNVNAGYSTTNSVHLQFMKAQFIM